MSGRIAWVQDEVAERVLDRLEDCTRPFPRALILGGAGVQVLDLLGAGRAGVKQATLVDTSQAMLDRARLHLGAASWAGQGALQTEFVRADPASELLPVEPGQYDGERGKYLGVIYIYMILFILGRYLRFLY